MVSKVLIFLGTLVIVFCIGKMISEISKNIDVKKKLGILFLFGCVVFLILFFRLDEKFCIISSLVCSLLVTSLELFLEKFIPL